MNCPICNKDLPSELTNMNNSMFFYYSCHCGDKFQFTTSFYCYEHIQDEDGISIFYLFTGLMICNYQKGNGWEIRYTPGNGTWRLLKSYNSPITPQAAYEKMQQYQRLYIFS